MTDRQREKRERFRRVAARRTETALKALRALTRCANPTGYDYRDDEVEAMLDTLGEAFTDLEKAFRPRPREIQRPFEFPAARGTGIPNADGTYDSDGGK